jgi:hypothetical protein
MVGRLWGPCAQVVGPVDGWEVVIQPDLPGAHLRRNATLVASDPAVRRQPMEGDVKHWIQSTKQVHPLRT